MGTLLFLTAQARFLLPILQKPDPLDTLQHISSSQLQRSIRLRGPARLISIVVGSVTTIGHQDFILVEEMDYQRFSDMTSQVLAHTLAAAESEHVEIVSKL